MAYNKDFVMSNVQKHFVSNICVSVTVLLHLI